MTADEEDFIQTQELDAEAVEKAWEFFRHRGGRLLRYPSAVVDDSQADAQDEHDKSFWSDSTTFTMNLFSDRDSPVTVTDMRAVEISCVAPTAQTLIEYNPEGNEAYVGVLFDLSKPDRGPVITDDDDRGRPFFESRKIDLGGGLSPGGLRVEAVTTRRSCRWKIEATYQNSSQDSATLILDDEGEPFFTEATPPRPRQHWTTGMGDDNLVRMIPCHEQPSAADCKFRVDAFR